MSSYTGRSEAIKVSASGATGYSGVGYGAPVSVDFSVADKQLALIWVDVDYGTAYTVEVLSGDPLVQHVVTSRAGNGAHARGWATGAGSYRVSVPGGRVNIVVCDDGFSSALIKLIDFFVDADYPEYSECYNGRCDQNGNFYVQCIGGDIPAHTETWLAMYTPNGDQQWVVPVDFVDNPMDVHNGSIVVCYFTSAEGIVVEKRSVEDGHVQWHTALTSPGYGQGDGGVAFSWNGDVWASYWVGYSPRTHYLVLLDSYDGYVKRGPVAVDTGVADTSAIKLQPYSGRSAVFLLPEGGYGTSTGGPVMVYDSYWLYRMYTGADVQPHFTASGYTEDSGCVVWSDGGYRSGASHLTKYDQYGNVDWDVPSTESAFNVWNDSVDFIPSMDYKLYVYGIDAAVDLDPARGWMLGTLVEVNLWDGSMVKSTRVNDELHPTIWPGSTTDDGVYLDAYGCAAAAGYVWMCGAAYDNYNDLLLNLVYGDQGFISVRDG